MEQNSTNDIDKQNEQSTQTIDQIKDDIVQEKKERRFFTWKDKEQCWRNAQFMFGRHPDRWRLDAFGNPVCKGCQGQFCYTYDHIQPYSKGGKSVLENCVIMQTKLNIIKSNKMHLNFSDIKNSLKKYSYTEEELDKFEQFIFGNVQRPSMNEYLNFKQN